MDRKKILSLTAAGLVLSAGGLYFLSKKPEIKAPEEWQELRDPEYEKSVYLTKEEAIHRAEIISQVTYRLVLSLNTNQTSFQGNVVITFYLAKASDKLFIDFKGRVIKRFMVNGTVTEGFCGHRLYIER